MTPLRSLIHFVCLSVLLLVPSIGYAQAQNPNAAQVEALKKQMESMQRQMQELQEQIKKLSAATAAPAAAAPVVEPQTPPPPSPPSQQVGEATGSRQTVAQDEQAAARVDNAPLDPKYPGFFRLPGTQTFLKIGGYFKTDFIYDGKPAGDSERFIPSSFPMNQPPVNTSTISIRPTRLSLDFRVPTAALGDVRFYVEGDMFGSSSTTPRLRHAYSQAKNFLIGQTFSNFMDPDASPDQLDFQGPNAQVNIRNPQIRYTFALAKKTSFAIAVEKPSSDVSFKTPEFSSIPNSPGPDGTLKLRQEMNSGHIQIAAVIRGVGAFLPNGASDTVVGWGLSLAGSQRVVGKDTFVYQAAYGNGIARYIQDSSGLGIDAAVVSNQQPYLTAAEEVGVYGAYQHFWVPKVRSSVIYGFVQLQNTAYQSGSTYHQSHYTAANLIFNPFGSLTIGTEFLYGWVVKKDGSSANAPRIMISAKYNLDFVTKKN